MNPTKEQLLITVEAIDDVLGEGYARKNPELIGRMMLAEQVGFAGYQISHAILEAQQDNDISQ